MDSIRIGSLDIDISNYPHCSSSICSEGSSMFLEASTKYGEKKFNFEVEPTHGDTDKGRYHTIFESERPQYRVSKSSRDGQVVLACSEYQQTLGGWLSKYLSSHSSVWSEDHSLWNEPWRKAKNKLTNRPETPEEHRIEWNLMRPDDVVAAVIAAIVRGVLEWHDRGNVHGHLDNLDNYLLNFRREWVGVYEIVEVDCFLLQDSSQDDTREPKSKNLDMKMLKNVILSRILDISLEKLPLELQHFVGLLDNEIPYDRDTNLLIRDHPALWCFPRKVQFWVSMIERVEKESDNGPEGLANQARIFLAMDAVKVRLHWFGGWHFRIPMGPMATFFISRNYHTKASDFFLFVRHLIVHHNAKEKNPEKRRVNGTKYETIHMGDSRDYAKQRFVEVVIAETFPMVMVYAHLELQISLTAA